MTTYMATIHLVLNADDESEVTELLSDMVWNSGVIKDWAYVRVEPGTHPGNEPPYTNTEYMYAQPIEGLALGSTYGEADFMPFTPLFSITTPTETKGDN